MGIRRRQAALSVLTANAIRPVPGFRPGIPAFLLGWFTGELAPHLMGAVAADAAHELLRRRRTGADRGGLALAALNAAGLAYLIAQGRQAASVAEQALEEGLGLDYAEVLERQPTPAELATPWRKLLNPFRIREDGVRVERDIAYVADTPEEPHGRRGLLDVYLPVTPTVERAPVLLQVHGGGWTLGSKDQQGIPLMQHLAARGWVCVAINYRLAPHDPWPAQIVDLKRAIAWIREHIEAYGGDPEYLAITGGSAGGHLAALAALTPSDPAFQPGFEDADTHVEVAVPHYGVYDVADAMGTTGSRLMRDRFLAPRIFRTRFAEHPERFEAASPVLRVTDEAPDMFVIHGRRDSLVPVVHARSLVARLRETSRRTVVYAELPGAQHAFDVFPSIRSQHVVRAVERYLQWHWNTWRDTRIR